MAWVFPRSPFPHMSSDAVSPPQTFGRAGDPKIMQRLSWSSCTQRSPAGLPCGMPGIGELIDGAMQQAPHALRQEGAWSGAMRALEHAR